MQRAQGGNDVTVRIDIRRETQQSYLILSLLSR
jgi:hypothetical protein